MSDDIRDPERRDLMRLRAAVWNLATAVHVLLPALALLAPSHEAALERADDMVAEALAMLEEPKDE